MGGLARRNYNVIQVRDGPNFRGSAAESTSIHMKKLDKRTK